MKIEGAKAAHKHTAHQIQIITIKLKIILNLSNLFQASLIPPHRTRKLSKQNKKELIVS